MPTETLRPNGAGDATGLTASAGSNYQCVDEVTANGDTDYVYGTTAGPVVDYYALDDTALTTETVDSVDVILESKVSANATSGDRSQPGVRLSGSDTNGTLSSLTTSYVARQSPALVRPGGGSWAVSDLNGLQAKIGLYEDGADQSRATQIYVEINYTAGAGTVKVRSLMMTGVGM